MPKSQTVDVFELNDYVQELSATARKGYVREITPSLEAYVYFDAVNKVEGSAIVGVDFKEADTQSTPKHHH